jgi:hypothetical protein
MLHRLFTKFENLTDFWRHDLLLKEDVNALRILMTLLIPFRWIIILSVSELWNKQKIPIPDELASTQANRN